MLFIFTGIPFLGKKIMSYIKNKLVIDLLEREENYSVNQLDVTVAVNSQILVGNYIFK